MEEEVLTKIHEELAGIHGQLASLNSRAEVTIADVRELRSYVEKMETEAKEAMDGLMSPDKMMDMAGKFLGTG